MEVLANLEEIVERAKLLLLQAIKQKKGDIFSLVVAGGSTPKPLYEALAKEKLDGSQLHIFWGDERYVPPTDPQSNQKMVKEAWLDRVNLPAANIHPMPTYFASPAEAAMEYQRHLESFFALTPPAFPVFDFVLLGMGDDGHTASLFPHTEALRVTDRWVTVGQKDNQPRLTLTVPVLNNAKQIVFLVSGASKQQALQAVLAPTGDNYQYPARLIKGNVLWLVDRAAFGKNE